MSFSASQAEQSKSEQKDEGTSEISSAKQKLERLEEEISVLKEEGYSVQELGLHIDKLHEYNEIKDATQIVLGQLAVLEGVTVKRMHEKYGLTDDSTNQ